MGDRGSDSPLHRDPDPAPQVISSGDRFAGYELLEQLGSGGHGEVWRVRGRGGRGPDLALKVLTGEPGSRNLTQLEREAAVLTRLEHPNIVRLFDLVADGDAYGLITELVHGGSLADRLPGDPPSVRRSVLVVSRIAEALRSTHGHGLVHGDIKPSNILLTSEGDPKLADFGLAGWLGYRSSISTEGTEAYLAPEVLAGSPASARSDVFALGVTTFELLVGRPPHRGRGWASPLLDLPISDPLAHAVTRAISRDAFERVDSAESFGHMLSLTPEASPDSTVIGSGHRSSDEEAGRNLQPQPQPQPQLETGAAHRSAPVVEPDTRRFGPRPPDSPEVRSAVPERRAMIAVVALAVVLILVVFVVAASI